MKIIRKYIYIIILVLPLFSFSQEVNNIHFEQSGKQIHIYYDLQGSDTYTVQVFCSTNNGQSWEEPLKNVTGNVAEGQKQGKGKMIVWDVLAEREKLSGNISFRIIVINDVGVFTDSRDGQTYKWVKIGYQVWMAENLNYKTENSWCYDNKETNCNKYGRLYNWETARTACPSGWHLPSDEEWKVLEMFLSMSQSDANKTGYRGADEGKKLKSTSGWDSNGNGADVVGFTALPGGYRYTNGDFDVLGSTGYWWSATSNGSTIVWYRVLHYFYDGVRRDNNNKDYGFSVRCVRD